QQPADRAGAGGAGRGRHRRQYRCDRRDPLPLGRHGPQLPLRSHPEGCCWIERAKRRFGARVSLACPTARSNRSCLQRSTSISLSWFSPPTTSQSLGEDGDRLHATTWSSSWVCSSEPSAANEPSCCTTEPSHPNYPPTLLGSPLQHSNRIHPGISTLHSEPPAREFSESWSV